MKISEIYAYSSEEKLSVLSPVTSGHTIIYARTANEKNTEKVVGIDEEKHE